MEDEVIINCDWLQYSVLLEDDDPEFECPDGFRLEVLQGNNIFRHRIIVWDGQGRKWLTLLWSPFSSRLPKRIMTVQVANELLYGYAINMSFNLLQKIVHCRFNSLGRVDICADFQMSKEKMEVLKHLNSGHYYVQAKSEGSTWWHKENDTKNGMTFFNNHLHCQTWGSHKSQIKVKCYYKSREQDMLAPDPCPDKPYIIKMWEDAGWDLKNVWRLEFSLSKTSKGMYENKHIGLAEVSSSEWMTHLFYQLYTSRFIVRQNEGKKNKKKNEDRIVPFLTLPKEDSLFRWSVGDNQRPELSSAVKALRALMTQTQSEVIMCNKDAAEYLATTVMSVVRNNRLETYFHNHYSDSVEGWAQTYVNSTGEGIFNVDGHPDKTWN